MQPFVYDETVPASKCRVLVIFQETPRSSESFIGLGLMIPHNLTVIGQDNSAIIGRTLSGYQLIVFVSDDGLLLTDEQYALAKRINELGIPFIILPKDIASGEAM